MDKINKKNNIFINIFSTVIFFAFLVSTIWMFWSGLGKSIMNSGGQLGVSVSLPSIYYVFSCVFAVVLVVYVIFALKLKKLILVLLPLCYQLLTVLSVICFAVLASDPNNSAYVIYIITFSLFAPLYGFCELTYIWSLFLILPLFFATVIVTYKVFRMSKKEFLNKK